LALRAAFTVVTATVATALATFGTPAFAVFTTFGATFAAAVTAFSARRAVAIAGLVELDRLQAQLGRHFLDDRLLKEIVNGFESDGDEDRHDQGGGRKGQGDE